MAPPIEGHAPGFKYEAGQIVWAMMGSRKKDKKASNILWPAVLGDVALVGKEGGDIPAEIGTRRTINQEPVGFFSSTAGVVGLDWAFSPTKELKPFFANMAAQSLNATKGKNSKGLSNAIDNCHRFLDHNPKYQEMEDAYMKRVAQDNETEPNPPTAAEDKVDVKDEVVPPKTEPERKKAIDETSSDKDDQPPLKKRNPPLKSTNAASVEAQSAATTLCTLTAQNGDVKLDEKSAVEVKKEPTKKKKEAEPESPPTPNSIAVFGSGPVFDIVWQRLRVMPSAIPFESIPTSDEQTADERKAALTSAVSGHRWIFFCAPKAEVAQARDELVTFIIETKCPHRTIVDFTESPQFDGKIPKYVEVFMASYLSWAPGDGGRLVCHGSAKTMAALEATLTGLGRPLFFEEGMEAEKLLRAALGLRAVVETGLREAAAVLGSMEWGKEALKLAGLPALFRETAARMEEGGRPLLPETSEEEANWYDLRDTTLFCLRNDVNAPLLTGALEKVLMAEQNSRN